MRVCEGVCDHGSRWLQWQVRWSSNRMRVTLSLSLSLSLPLSDDWLQLRRGGGGGSDGQDVF